MGTHGVECQKPQSLALALRIPPWARSMRVACDGVQAETPHAGRRVRLSRTWGASTVIDIEFVTGLRTVAWPAREPKGVGVFDGPLCLGLSSETAHVDLPWAVLVQASGQVVPDGKGRPQVALPTGRTVRALEPISARWLTPNVKDPARQRILFQTRKAE